MSQNKTNVRDLFRYVDFIRMRTNDAMNAIEQDFPFKLSSSNYHIHIIWTVQLLNQIVNAFKSKRRIFDSIFCSTFRLLHDHSKLLTAYTIYNIHITDSSEMKKFSRISKLTLKVWGHLSVWHILVYFIEKICKFLAMAAVGIIFKNLLIFSDTTAYRHRLLFVKFWFDFIAMDGCYICEQLKTIIIAISPTSNNNLKCFRFSFIYCYYDYYYY